MTDPQAQNTRYRVLLGWDLDILYGPGTAPIDNATLVEKVRFFQKNHGLPEDGVVGPVTYRAFLDEHYAADMLVLKSLTTHSPERVPIAGRMALNRARHTWTMDVVDPRRGLQTLPDGSRAPYPDEPPVETRSRVLIERMIREGLNWTWETYERDGDYEWCGAHVAWCYRDVVKPDYLKNFFSSTYRLDRFFQYKPFENRDPGPRPQDPKHQRLYLRLDETSGPDDVPVVPDPGDILLVGGANSDYGKHITLVEDDEFGGGPVLGFLTYEGNGGSRGAGVGPRGTTRHGVIRHVRPIGLHNGEAKTVYHARRLLRFGPEDIEPQV